MFTIVEPQWGIDLLLSLNARMMSSPTSIYWIPKLADIFVFVYPVFLVLLYFWRKVSALFIGFSVLAAVVVNLVIQYVVDKVRPDVVLGLIDNKTESILHDFLPASSFPSDHAAISMAIAMATLLWGITRKDRRFVWMSIPLFVFSFIMSFSRITAAIHRPTDIIAGSVVGIVMPMMVILPRFRWLERVFSWIGRKV